MGCDWSKEAETNQKTNVVNSSSTLNEIVKSEKAVKPAAIAAVLVPSQTSSTVVQTACFGAGCYWGTEKYFKYDFTKKFPNLGTLKTTAVGFMGPASAPANPTYQEVCSGVTGHVEVLHVEYTGGTPYFEQLVRFFFQFHDPTTTNQQGNDKGTQYASFIYCENDEQIEIANRIKQEIQSLLDTNKLSCFKESQVTTHITHSTVFYPAQDEHQDYLTKNPNGYCNHRIRFSEWPGK
jgi:peptide-methionine (S)-S-oxide reductase